MWLFFRSKLSNYRVYLQFHWLVTVSSAFHQHFLYICHPSWGNLKPNAMAWRPKISARRVASASCRTCHLVMGRRFSALCVVLYPQCHRSIGFISIGYVLIFFLICPNIFSNIYVLSNMSQCHFMKASILEPQLIHKMWQAVRGIRWISRRFEARSGAPRSQRSWLWDSKEKTISSEMYWWVMVSYGELMSRNSKNFLSNDI